MEEAPAAGAMAWRKGDPVRGSFSPRLLIGGVLSRWFRARTCSVRLLSGSLMRHLRPPLQVHLLPYLVLLPAPLGPLIPLPGCRHALTPRRGRAPLEAVHVPVVAPPAQLDQPTASATVVHPVWLGDEAPGQGSGQPAPIRSASLRGCHHEQLRLPGGPELLLRASTTFYQMTTLRASANAARRRLRHPDPRGAATRVPLRPPEGGPGWAAVKRPPLPSLRAACPRLARPRQVRRPSRVGAGCPRPGA